MWRAWPVLLTVVALACELTEVTVPEGEPRVVVQAVLSVGAPQQIVVVERSLTGSVARDSGDPYVPPGEPRLPIDSATVILTHEGPSACASPVDTLRAQDTRGVYVTSDGFCDLVAGDRVQLWIETPDGTVVTGQTTVPGARWVSVRLSADSATASHQDFSLDRQRDTVRIAVDPILWRGLQVEMRESTQPDSLAVYLFTDTLGVALPGNLINPFEGDTGKPVFEVGKWYNLTVAVVDSNYFDFVRSASDPITGRGFLNHLEGGIGVFGSVAPYRFGIHVVR